MELPAKMNKITNIIVTRIKSFFMKYTNNSSHTISADIKEFFATYVLSVGYYVMYILPQRDRLKRTKELKNTKKGKKCFVLANGPSINLLNLKKIKKYQESGFDVFCVNSSISTEIAKTIIPDYYILSCPNSFCEHAYGEIKLLNESDIPLFIPAQFLKLKLITNYYIFNDFENRFSRNIDPTKPRGYCTMTAYKALAIACFMGYDKIYICGFDNDYFKTISVDENNDIYIIDKHFYDSGVKIKSTPAVGKGMGDLMWEHYRLFKTLELFTHHDIINLNKNGLIDTFSKKPDIDIYRDDK